MGVKLLTLYNIIDGVKVCAAGHSAAEFMPDLDKRLRGDVA